MARKDSSRLSASRARPDGNRRTSSASRSVKSHRPSEPCRSGCHSKRSCESWQDLLCEFSEALGDTETTCSALFALEEDLAGPAGAAVASLHRRLSELKSIYTEFEAAILEMDDR